MATPTLYILLIANCVAYVVIQYRFHLERLLGLDGVFVVHFISDGVLRSSRHHHVLRHRELLLCGDYGGRGPIQRGHVGHAPVVEELQDWIHRRTQV